MHTCQITLQHFADVLELTSVTSRQDDGMFMTTTGHHPELGAVTLVQGFTLNTLVSELRYRDPDERRAVLRRDLARLLAHAAKIV